MKTWRDIEELSDRAQLIALIEQEGTPTRIARRLGCSRESVRGAMRFYGLKPRYWTAGEETRKKLEL